MLNDPFADLTDDLDEAIAAVTGPVDTTLADRQQYKMLHEEPCKSCGGTGTFRSYGGRALGACFKCKGSGKLVFRQSLEKRQQQAAQRAKRAETAREDLNRQVDAWSSANGSDYTWMCDQAPRFEFAQAMLVALRKYGTLSEKQHATVTRLRIANDERNAARAAEAQARLANAPSANVQAILDAFASAQQNGVKRPKVRLANYKFSLAPETGSNAGAIYVTAISEDAYLGKIRDGRFIRVRECSNEQEGEIVAVASDPHNAAIAYGTRTGQCSCCNRELTNHASIDIGIGPICASKYGW